MINKLKGSNCLARAKRERWPSSSNGAGKARSVLIIGLTSIIVFLIKAANSMAFSIWHAKAVILGMFT